MITEQQVDATYSIAADNASIDAFARSSHEVIARCHRLQSDFYASKGYLAAQQVANSGFHTEEIGAVATVAWPDLFKRFEVNDEECGAPFLTTSEMMLGTPTPSRYLSKALTPSLSTLQVYKGTILISRSGTVGNVAIATSDIDGFALSEDALRVRLTDETFAGPVYAFLCSQAGQYLLTSNKSGSVVEHLYENDVASLSLPLLPKQLRIELSRLIELSCDLRVKANRLLNEAQEQVQRSCYLPGFKDIIAGRVSDGPAMFVVHSAAATSRNMGPGDVRLDATAFDPIADNTRAFLLGKEGATTLGVLAKRIHRIAPGKRSYVDDIEAGFPLIGGKQMMQWRVRDVKYISRALTVRNAQQTCVRGTTLIATGGTIGRTMYVHRNFESAIASEDVMRIVPDEQRVYSGFLYAFLSSPYAQIQIQQRIFGSVIPRIRHFHLPSLVVPVPRDLGEAVHALVVSAFDARGDAHAVEDGAVTLFEESLHRGRSYVEAEWGAEY